MVLSNLELSVIRLSCENMICAGELGVITTGDVLLDKFSLGNPEHCNGSSSPSAFRDYLEAAMSFSQSVRRLKNILLFVKSRGRLL